jgi:hypothetical protein
MLSGWRAVAATAALAALLAPAVASAIDPAQRQLSFAPIDTLPLPVGDVTGVTWRGPDTLAVLVVLRDTLDGEPQEQVLLSLHDRSGALFEQVDFTGSLQRGLAFDGSFFWSCGDEPEGGSLVYKIDADTLVVKDVYPTPGHRPMALTWDDRYVWISDRDSGRLDRLDPETGDVTRSVFAPGFSPCGLAWDGRYMWVTDSGTGRLYRLAGSRRTWNATVDLASFFYRGADVLLAHDATWLWYLPPGARGLVRVQFE